MMRGLAAVLLTLFLAAGALAADDPVEYLPRQSKAVDGAGGALITLTLSRGVPYRAFTLDAPRRLVLEFQAADWQGSLTAKALRPFTNSARITDVQITRPGPGWTRASFDLAGPSVLHSADMQFRSAGGTARLVLQLGDNTPEEFTAAASAPDLAQIGSQPMSEAKADGPLVVMLDPGHGGQDAGASEGGVVEKDIALIFAQDVAAAFERVGGIQVILTRSADHFVSLEARVAMANKATPDVFLSLHADDPALGGSGGAAVYLLSDSASDAASAALAERHDRDNILKGVDLTGQDDTVAGVLMDLARQKSGPRARKLAEILVGEMVDQDLPTNRYPIREAGFSVLKSPSVPSIMLQLGVMSNPRDRANLNDPAWRVQMAGAVAQALLDWQRTAP